MYKIILFFLISAFVFSCKSSYTGFAPIKYKSLTQKHLKAENVLSINNGNISAKLEKTELPIFTVSNTSLLIDKKQVFERKLKTVIEGNNVNYNLIKNKSSFAEKMASKIIQKKIFKLNKKSNAIAKPDSFDSLDNNLKIGIVLIAAAIVLSLLSLGFVAGLAGLVGLVFVIIGLLNTYN